jgi:hypothetical protein
MYIKKLFNVLFAVMIITGYSACETDNPDKTGITDDNVIIIEDPDYPSRPSASIFPLTRQAGDFMQYIKPLDTAYAALCNNSGLNGAEGRIQWHGNDAGTMYAGVKQDFVFDIGHIDQLGELHIWNYNASGSTGNGIKNVTVLFSEDNATYTICGTFTLKQADGSAKLPATNLADGKCIDLNGRSARYIKLSPVDNYGGGQYGLSAIRVYRYKQDVYKGAYIAASPVEKYYTFTPPASYNLTNGTGLSHPFSADAKHDNNPAHMYYTNNSTAGFVLDLKGKYPVEKIVIWNYNDKDHTDYGLRTIGISVSDDQKVWTSQGPAYTVPQANGENGLEPSLVIDTSLHARYIRIDNARNWGGASTGLSAVRCYTGLGWFADDAPDWTALFSNYEGWTGADGIYSVNLDGKDYDPARNQVNQKTFFIFSDTMIGSVDPVTGRRSGTGRSMPSNTYGILSGGKPDAVKMEFTWKTTALIAPNPPEAASNGGNKYYWMGDPFVVRGKLYIFALKIDRIEGGLGFTQVGVDLVSYNITNGAVDQASLQHYNDTSNKLCDVSVQGRKWYLGSAVFENTSEAGALSPDGYIYVYGYHDGGGRRLFVARVKDTEVEDLSKYQYFSADNTWVDNMDNPKFLASNIAPEISVHEVKTGSDRGKFYLVYTFNTTGSDIRLGISTSFTEAFDTRTIFIHDTVDAIIGPNNGNNSYNAKAHPAISNDKELFISYNMNGGDWDAFNYGDIYRPRFIRYAQVPVVF